MLNFSNIFNDERMLEVLKDLSTRFKAKVDVEEGKSLVSTADITQITTNKTNIESLESDKVDKVSGKELVSTSDITQITTNKTNIESLTSRVQETETELEGVAEFLESKV